MNWLISDLRKSNNVFIVVLLQSQACNDECCSTDVCTHRPSTEHQTGTQWNTSFTTHIQLNSDTIVLADLAVLVILLYGLVFIICYSSETVHTCLNIFLCTGCTQTLDVSSPGGDHESDAPASHHASHTSATDPAQPHQPAAGHCAHPRPWLWKHGLRCVTGPIRHAGLYISDGAGHMSLAGCFCGVVSPCLFP